MGPRERQTYYPAYNQAESVLNSSHHTHILPVELPAELPETDLPAANRYRQQEGINQKHPRSAKPRERSVEIRTRSSQPRSRSRKVPEREETTESELYTMGAPQAREERNPRSSTTRNVIRKRAGSRDDRGDDSRIRSRSRAARQRGDNDRTARPYPAEPATSSSRTTKQREAYEPNDPVPRLEKDPTVRAAHAATYEGHNRRREPEPPVYPSDKRTTRPSHASVQRQQRGADSHPRHFPPARYFEPSEASSVSSGQGGNTVPSTTSTSDESEITPWRRSLKFSMRHMASVKFNDDDQSQASGASSLGRRR
jgi:hypothetical protein